MYGKVDYKNANFEESGNFEYNLLDKHVEYSDQHMGAAHPSLSNIDVKLMKVCNIIMRHSLLTTRRLIHHTQNGIQSTASLF